MWKYGAAITTSSTTSSGAYHGSPLLNPAGGLRYHWRARKYAKKLWEPFRWALGEWLLGWQPPEPTLVLVGPSGGYNLQPFVFERFERVVVLEPDPIARWVFARRLAKAPLDRRPKLELIAEDHLIHDPERLPALLEQQGNAALLFSNVIGQIKVLLDIDAPNTELARVKAAVHRAIAGRSWASFHDRVSGSLVPSLEDPIISPQRWSDDEVLSEAYYGSTPSEDPELHDHLTEGFFPAEAPHTYFRWQLDPTSYHLIEAVASVTVNEPSPLNAVVIPRDDD
ncbi:MAG: hypothetical protein ABW217_07470 [Polyangiaceae bacterium]